MTDEEFVGRRDEQARFAALLRELTAARDRPQGRWHSRQPSGKDVADAARSQVVLVHGPSGIGKSTLLTRLLDMADGRAPGTPVRAGAVRTGWLDWEDEADRHPRWNAVPAGPGLVPVLNVVQAAVFGAFSGEGAAARLASQPFEEYSGTLKQRQRLTDPARELIRRFAVAVRVSADRKPLVLFIDSGEVIGDRALGWLCRVMTRTGPRVTWVIAARTETDMGSDGIMTTFVREIGDKHLTLMPPGCTKTFVTLSAAIC